MARIDMNCDLGEGAGHDAELMPLLTSANIACGIHAGDVDTMRAAVELALKHNVAIGAHPSLNDRVNFGRREMLVTAREVYFFVLTQTRLLQIIAQQCGTRLAHVKPHGALYNMAARDAALADAVADAVYEVNPALILFGLAGSQLIEAGKRRGLRVANEVFADRTYEANGSLTPRTEPEAMIVDHRVAVTQVLQVLRDGKVRTRSGVEVALVAETICLHGDRPNAVHFATNLHKELRAAGFLLTAVGA